MMLVNTNYSEKLKQTIKTSGMLLDADKLWNASHSGETTTEAVFELNSGRFQKKFITLWELFNMGPKFKECINELTDAALDLKRQKPYTSIVTCTPTARYVTEHLHSRIETDDEFINVHFLGHHPFFTVDHKPFFDFQSERVLIITDTIANGNLVKSMAQKVEKLGGVVIAVLCIVIVNKDMIAEPIIDIGTLNPKKVEIRFLVDYPIDDVRAPLQTKHIIKIDKISILPETAPPSTFKFKPIIDEHKMLTHFDDSQSVNFNFFKADDRCFTIAVNISRLLKAKGDEIWSEIENDFQPDSIIVTTFDIEDFKFNEFIQKKLNHKVQNVYISKKEPVIWSNRYFILDQFKATITDKPVVLLLSSVSMAEKLKSLVSLLASFGATEIKTICLFNRMGPKTANFILRIQTLLKGMGGSMKEKAVFSFRAVYSLSDLDSEEISRTQIMLNELFSRYAKLTSVSSFERLSKNDIKYFNMKRLTSKHFQQSSDVDYQNKKEVQIHIPGLDIKGIKSSSGIFVKLIYEIRSKRNYIPLIKFFRNIHTLPKEFVPALGTLYRLYAILLTDLDYLKVTNTYTELIESLKDSIKNLRKERFSINVLKNPDHVNELIALESQLCFGLCLFCYLYPNYTFIEETAIELLTCNKTLMDWKEKQRHMLMHFGSEKIAYITSLFIHLSYPRFKKDPNAKKLKNAMISKIKQLIRFIQYARFPDEEGIKTQINKSYENLTSILSELGVFDRQRKYELIRHLHSRLLGTTSGHSPIDSGLNAVLVMFEKHITIFLNSFTLESNDIEKEHLRITIEDENFGNIMSSGINSVYILEEISRSAKQLLQDAESNFSKSRKYIYDSSQPGFSYSIKQLGDFFEEIRITHEITISKFQQIKRLVGELKIDIWDEKASYLRKFSKKYISNLYRAINNAFLLVNAELVKQGLPSDIFVIEKVEFNERIKDFQEIYVLSDKEFLVEILKNIFKNVTHNLKDKSSNEKPLLISKNRIIISPLYEKVTVEDPSEIRIQIYKLEFYSFGNPYSGMPDDCTFIRHRNKLREFFDGDMEIEPNEEGGDSGTKVTLKLRHRQNPSPKSLKEAP